MKFKVGDEVITVDSKVGVVISVVAKYIWGGDVLQPIQVMFTNKLDEFYSEDGTYHPGHKTVSDIRLLTKLEKAMR